MKKLLLLLALFIPSIASANCPQPIFPNAPCPQPGVISTFGGQSENGETGLIGSLPNPWNWPGYQSGHSLNYVYSIPLGSGASNLLGRTLIITYDMHSSGPCGTDCVAGATDTQNDAAPPSAYLFIWAQNDSGGVGYRWWCDNGRALGYGDNQTLSCKITDTAGDANLWSNVNGVTAPNDKFEFEATLNNPWAMGVTFGGEFFGHGVYQSAPGTVTFTVTGWFVM